jgi:hypothetical protein
MPPQPSNLAAHEWVMDYCAKTQAAFFNAQEMQLAFVSGAKWMLMELRRLSDGQEENRTNDTTCKECSS